MRSVCKAWIREAKKRKARVSGFDSETDQVRLVGQQEQFDGRKTAQKAQIMRT